MATGTPIVIGFYASSEGIPDIDERSFNEGVPYLSTAEVLSLLPLANRAKYLTVNVAGVEYWFSTDDLLTLTIKNTAASNTADNITVADVALKYDATDVEAALAEVMGYAESLGTAITALEAVKQNPYQIIMPAGNLTTKIAGATFVPAAWATVAINGSTNAMITHTLTDRKIAFVNVFEIDGADESLLSFDRGTAYTGIKGNGLTVLISGLVANNTLPVRIELIFD